MCNRQTDLKSLPQVSCSRRVRDMVEGQDQDELFICQGCVRVLWGQIQRTLY